ncbi:MAG: hypothetical protein P8163_20825 [Candidatus Thiodiazotropha sp.]
MAGIYGPGKLPLERLRKGLPMVSEAEAPITNHIHSLDLVRVARAAMERGVSGEVYNVCDGHPESIINKTPNLRIICMANLIGLKPHLSS